MTEFEETSKKIQDLVDEVFKQGVGVGYDHGLEVGTQNGYKRGYENGKKSKQTDKERLSRMTREDIDNIISIICPNDEDFEKPIISPAYLKKELETLALEQEPSGDLISRQELLEDLYKRDYTKFTHRDFVALVQYQDTVQQEPKTGHWIPTYGNVKCSVCGSVKESRRVGKATHYCDFCGAKMVEPQESEDK
jgi:hypothetical protein